MQSWYGHGMYPTLETCRGWLPGLTLPAFKPSYVTQFGTFGRAADLDRAERIAFNALPATWASPTGGDMWAHQYLQAVNQISAKLSHPHVLRAVRV